MGSLIASLSSNPTLATYIQGAGEQAKSAVADYIAPDVPVPTLMGKYKIWNAKEKLVIPETRRALGSDGTFVDLTLNGGTYNCEPHSLNVGVDFQEEQESNIVLNLIQAKARTAANLGGMAHEKRVLTKMLAGATGVDAIDTTSTTIDIIKILNGLLLQVIKGAKGWGANMELRVLFGAGALYKIINHGSIISRFKGTQPKGGFISPTATDIANMLMLQCNSQVSLMVQDVNANVDAPDVEFMLGDQVLVFASTPNPDDYDTSFMKTFRLMGQFMSARYWTAPSGRQNFAGFDWSEDIQIVNAAASALAAVG